MKKLKIVLSLISVIYGNETIACSSSSPAGSDCRKLSDKISAYIETNCQGMPKNNDQEKRKWTGNFNAKVQPAGDGPHSNWTQQQRIDWTNTRFENIKRECPDAETRARREQKQKDSETQKKLEAAKKKFIQQQVELCSDGTAESAKECKLQAKSTADLRIQHDRDTFIRANSGG